jgi:hypothetical protein
MKAPFFSVMIPTKNRSFLVGQAIQSVLRQTFKDFEVVVVDNDDTDATAKVVQSFSDPRLRHARTGGLSMHDNWEHAVDQARGEYVCILEDKQLLRGGALERIHQAAAQQPGTITWLFDVVDDVGERPRLVRGGGKGGMRLVPNDVILRGFTHDGLRAAAPFIPLPHRSAIHRELIRKIKAGPLKRLCVPVSPDYTSAYQQLAFGEATLFIEEPLVVVGSTRHSNGRAFQIKDKSCAQFTAGLGAGGERTYLRHVPIQALILSSTIYGDYAEVRSKVGRRLEAHPIHWATYFVECHASLMDSVTAGADMSMEERAWKQALAAQPPLIQEEVNERLTARKSLWMQKFNATCKSVRRRTGLPKLESAVKEILGRKRPDADEWRFDTLLEFLEWDEKPKAPTSRPGEH